MNWQNISVFQFQQLTNLWAEAKDKDPYDQLFEAVGICHGLTPMQVDSLSMQDFNKKCVDLAFLNEIPQWQPQAHFETEGRRYRFVYDVRQIHAARYMEVKQYSAQGMVAGLHRMAASMVIPQKRNWRRQWMDIPYDASRHSDYAADVLQAPITAIHGSAVFFCKLFATSTEILKDYLTKDLPMEKREAAKLALQISANTLGGSSPLPLLLSTKESHLSKRIRSRLFSS